MHSCSKDSLFPLLPKLSVEGKEKLGLVWLLLAEVFFGVFTPPKSEVLLKTQLTTPPNPLPKYSPEKLSGNVWWRGAPNLPGSRQGHLEGSGGAAGEENPEHPSAVSPWSCSSPGAFLGLFLGLRCLCLSALQAVQEWDFHQVLTSGRSDKKKE